jgi:hypothetical protein
MPRNSTGVIKQPQRVPSGDGPVILHGDVLDMKTLLGLFRAIRIIFAIVHGELSS